MTMVKTWLLDFNSLTLLKDFTVLIPPQEKKVTRLTGNAVKDPGRLLGHTQLARYTTVSGNQGGS